MSIENTLAGMSETEMFGITLYDSGQYITWASDSREAPFQLYPATPDRKSSAIEWLGFYRPDRDKLNSSLQEPLFKVLNALLQYQNQLPICAIVNASNHEEQKHIIQGILGTDANYDSQGFMKQRTVIPEKCMDTSGLKGVSAKSEFLDSFHFKSPSQEMNMQFSGIQVSLG